MAETLPPTPDEMDEMLAKFTDQVLAQTATDSISAPTEAELHELQKIVLLLNQLAEQRQPSQAQAQKIWGNLATQWQKNKIKAQPDSVWQRLGQRVNALQADLRSGNRGMYAAAAALVAIVVLVVLGSGITDAGDPLPGAAGGGDGLALVLVVLGLIIGVGVIWWWLRRSR